MNKVTEPKANASSRQPDRQSYWEAVLDLGVVIARHKSNLDKECFQRDSKFISMP
jgi:hypothetical protein